MTTSILPAIETAIYLVCVARSGTLKAPSLPGIEENTAPRIVTIGDFDAMVIDVPSDLFLAEDAEARMQDVAWLTPRAERHERLVRACMQQTCILPVGFGSVFSSSDVLEATLARHAESICEHLDETQGTAEWSLKLWTSRARAVQRAKQQITQEKQDQLGTGVAYLVARRLNDDAIKLAEDQMLDYAERLIDELGDTIVDITDRHATQPEDEPDRWLIAHLACLIDADEMSRFDDQLDQSAAMLEDVGIDIELSGPWPTYSFCPPFDQDHDESVD